MGILKTAATVAVASSVHGRIQRRQQQRWAAQDQAAGQAPPPAAQPPADQPPAAQPPPEAAPPPQATPAPATPAQPPSVSMSERLAQLSTLSDLKAAGVLTDAEFDEQKARILNG
ncbi:MAG TPA: SHOCT domain-containing protein [Trebonia sp.]|nr:SHOCT domain-containing protein [Trebonia sp.]